MEESRHPLNALKNQTGAANFTLRMADANVKFDTDRPINLWAVTDQWRSNSAPAATILTVERPVRKSALNERSPHSSGKFQITIPKTTNTSEYFRIKRLL